MSEDLYRKQTCRYSEEVLPKPFLELGNQPLANNYVEPGKDHSDEFKCPLSLVRAPESGLVQLSHVVPPQRMFEHYLYVSSTTQTFRDHFAEYAASVRAKIKSEVTKPLAVDIGSNDGLLVSCYTRQGMQGVGVDPAKNLAEAANKAGHETLNRYFDEESVRLITEKYGKAYAVSANNVFAHIDDIHAVCRNVKNLLHDDGLFVIEFPYLITMLEEMLFDMIYHEHLSYIAVKPLSYLLDKFGLQIFHIDRVSSHGGSLRVFIQKTGAYRPVSPIVKEMIAKEVEGGYLEQKAYDEFAARVMKIKSDFRALIAGFRKAGKKIAGYGAPAKASTLLNFYELSADDVVYVVDDNPLKQGLLIPGVHIPVVPSSRLNEDTPDVIIIFAWNFAAEILKKIGHFADHGTQFVLPLPGPQTAVAGASQSHSFEITPLAKK